MSTAAVRRGRPGYDIESLLAVAVEVFNERGYDGTSMEDLAQRLGISKSAIYHHVPSKDSLLGLALDRALIGLEEAAGQVRRMEGRAVERLESLVRASVVVLVEQVPYVTLLLRVHGNSRVECDALARRRRLDRLAATLVAEARREGDLRPDVDPKVTARLIFGMVNSLVEWVRPGSGRDAETLATAVTAVAFDGLRTVPSR
ncbi:MAG: TetR/AcrR family transcriptional regulator [Actinomycetota bacterium]|nr:TetR/AcrR family transcriptional regulator [Actinomycetota bacterium]